MEKTFSNSKTEEKSHELGYIKKYNFCTAKKFHNVIRKMTTMENICKI